MRSTHPCPPDQYWVYGLGVPGNGIDVFGKGNISDGIGVGGTVGVLVAASISLKISSRELSTLFGAAADGIGVVGKGNATDA